MDQNKVYLNGSLVDSSSACIAANDAGFLHGASVFTTMLAHKGRVFRLDEHLRRLLRTQELFNLRCRMTADDLGGAVYQVLQANALTEARMRITLTPGPIDKDQPTVLVTAQTLDQYPERWYEHGISVIVSTFKQVVDDPTSGVKTGCYFLRMLGRREAAAKNADEAIWYTSDGRLAEACFSNVFLVIGGKVFTPPLDTPVLAGVVRQAVMEICASLGIDCDDRTPMGVEEMLEADEMFLTASCAGIRPVASVEQHKVGAGEPGEITRRIMAAYRELLETECEPGA